MALISNDYRQLNAGLHDTDPEYGSRGSKWEKKVRRLADEYGCTSILDYGCGKTKMEGIARYDPAIPSVAKDPKPADLVMCVDVLEHVEPEHLNAVLKHIAGLSSIVTFMVVATRPSNKTLADGRNAHLIVEPREWWVPRIMKHWGIAELLDSGELEYWQDRGRFDVPKWAPGKEFSVVGTPL